MGRVRRVGEDANARRAKPQPSKLGLQGFSPHPELAGLRLHMLAVSNPSVMMRGKCHKHGNFLGCH